MSNVQIKNPEVVDLSNAPAVKAASLTEESGGAQEFKTVFDYPKTTMKEQSICNIRVTRPSQSQRRSNDNRTDAPEVLANISFCLVLDNGKAVPYRGAKLKILDPEKGPFVSVEGFTIGDNFYAYVPLTMEQMAFLARYAIKEMEKWTDEIEIEQSDEEF